MSSLRRSPRLQARVNNRKYVSRPLHALRTTLQDRLFLLDQAPALKEGWITQMMGQFRRQQEKLDGPAMGLYILACSGIPCVASDERERIRTLLVSQEIAKLHIKDIREGHGDTDDLAAVYRDMLRTVELLLSHIK